MDRIKALFISTYLTLLMGASGLSIWEWVHDASRSSPWIGTLIAAVVPLSFFARAFIAPVPRTSENLWWIPLFGAAGTVTAGYLGGLGWPALIALTVGVVLSLIYIFWYSRFSSRDSTVLRIGCLLPDLSLEDLDGRIYHTDELTLRPTLWVFYRGNWCPFCMAQIREIAEQYRDLATRGVNIHLVSPQPQTHTKDLAEQFNVPMRFLTDRDNQAAGQLGILAEGGLPMGMQILGYDSDVPLPTVFITAPGGKIVYCDLTENYRLRPEPADFLRALTAAGF